MPPVDQRPSTSAKEAVRVPAVRAANQVANAAHATNGLPTRALKSAPAAGSGRLGGAEWLAGGESEVLGVEDCFVEQRGDVVVVQRIDDLSAGALTDH